MASTTSRREASRCRQNNAVRHAWSNRGIIEVGAIVCRDTQQTATQSTVATGGFIGLVIGVLLQAVNSYHGSQKLRHAQPPRADDTRPRANPLRDDRPESTEVSLCVWGLDDFASDRVRCPRHGPGPGLRRGAPLCSAGSGPGRSGPRFDATMRRCDCSSRVSPCVVSFGRYQLRSEVAFWPQRTSARACLTTGR
jgi:hypothetical protein